MDGSKDNYEKVWSELCDEITLQRLRNLSFEFKLNSIPFKTVCWKILLGYFIEHDVNNWMSVTEFGRKRYKELMDSFQLDPHSTKDPNDNPLSQEKDSIWYRYLCNVELKANIKKDIYRTEPSNLFFSEAPVIEMMINILFCYARQYENVCYRQGMNEILGNILLAMKDDFNMLDQVTATGFKNDALCHLLNPNYFEQDAFCLFEVIMNRIKQFYETGLLPNLYGELPISSLCLPAPDSDVADEFKFMRKNVLSVYDSRLDSHLRDLNIEFTVFGVRWLRLLFGREFPREILFKIWNVIFAYDKHFTLAYYVLTSMLIWIRRQLLSSSHDGCMNLLMKYPRIPNPEQMVSFALHTREPTMFPAFDISELLTPINDVFPQTRDSYVWDVWRDPNVIVNSNGSEVTDMVRKFKRLSTFSPYSKNKTNKGNPYSRPCLPSTSSSDNVQKMYTELSKYKSVMAFCKLKVDVVKGMMSTNNFDSDANVNEILSGLDQLSLMLDVNAFPKTAENAVKITEITPNQTTVPLKTDSPSPITEHLVALNLPPPKTSINMTVFSCTEQKADNSKFPIENPLQQSLDNSRF